jgi:hypothetical protein
MHTTGMPTFQMSEPQQLHTGSTQFRARSSPVLSRKPQASTISPAHITPPQQSGHFCPRSMPPQYQNSNSGYQGLNGADRVDCLQFSCQNNFSLDNEGLEDRIRRIVLETGST